MRELNPRLSHHKAEGYHYPNPDTLAEAFLAIPLAQKYVTKRWTARARHNGGSAPGPESITIWILAQKVCERGDGDGPAGGELPGLSPDEAAAIVAS